MKKWFDRLSSWFFQIENEILVPFLLVEILVILGFFGISFYNGYTMQLENQRAMAETMFTEVNRDINFLAETMPEEMLREKYFLRVSKSILLNLLKVQAIRPAAGGRFTAILKNGEEVVISRKYVPELKKALKGGVSL